MTSNCYCPTLEVHSWRIGADGPSKTCPSVQELCTNAADDSPPQVSVIFAQAEEISKCKHCRPALSQAFAIPEMWWALFAKRSNGYFGFEDLLDNRGNRVGAVSWVRFIMKHTFIKPSSDGKGTAGSDDDPIDYYWRKLNALARWHAFEDRTEIILFDHKELAEPIIKKLLENINREELSDPFWVYPRMIEEIVDEQDRAVWETRDLVRDFEKQRPLYGPKQDFRILHEIPRHLIHVSETLNVAETTLISIQKHHDHFLTTVDPHTGSSSIKNRLSFHHHMLTSLRHRSDSNNARIKNEMVLTYNELTRVDSSAMRTIAFVSLAFLPATFVSAVFSTSFFNFDAGSGTWAMSNKFWYYWAVSIPLTLLTVLLWYGAPYIWEKVPPKLRKQVS